MTENLMVYMVTQEKRGSPEAEVTYFASITYHLQKKKKKNNQSLFITAILSHHSVGRSGAWQYKTSARRSNSLWIRPIIVSSRKPPHKEAKTALRDKKKNKQTTTTAAHKGERIRLTCLHLIQNFDTAIRVYCWQSKTTEVATLRAKKKITKNQYSCTLRFTVYICKMLF